MSRRIAFSLIALFVSAILLSIQSGPIIEAAPVVPAGFTDAALFDIARPTALAFTSDNRVLVTTQPGRLYVYKNGALLGTAALDIAAKVCSNSERGMLGVAIDPGFDLNQQIYLYYTFNKFGGCPTDTTGQPVNRVSRFTFKAAPNIDQIDPASELVLLDNMPSPNGNHNAGDLHFGQDNLLYVSVGDGGCKVDQTTLVGNSSLCAGQNDNSLYLNLIGGKILRINRDGSIPTTNPYYNAANSRRCGNPAGVPSGAGPCQETFAWGLRNPFRFNFKPGTNSFYINDVGQNIWEEIDDGQKNANYGWNTREGPCANGSTSDCSAPPANLTNPIYSYQHNTGCASITGGAFVPNSLWPAAFEGSYLYSDYVCGKIFQLSPNASGGVTSSDFISGLGTNSAVHLSFGPYNSTQALYYTTYVGGACGGCGQIHVVYYSGNANRAPTAVLTASPLSGPTAPLAVNFNANGSSDPDAGDTLTEYQWDFGDGATVTTTGPTTSHTYSAVGTYTASLRVKDNRNGLSSPATVKIYVGAVALDVRILSPMAAIRFKVGQVITLSGRASDSDGNVLPDSALSWTVILHHNSHTHPFFGPTSGNNLTIVAPNPEDLAATQTSYLEIQLTATNSSGLATTISQNLQPHLVNIGVGTTPSGASFSVNGTSFNNSQTLVSWENYALNVQTTSPQTLAAQTLVFIKWSDGDTNLSRTILTPATAQDYAALFSINGCDASVVNKNSDEANLCGTLRYAASTVNPAPGTVISFSGAGLNIGLTDTLALNTGTVLQSSCVGGVPDLTIDGGAVAATKPGLVATGRVRLEGVKLTGFKGLPLKLSGNGNVTKCVEVKK